LGSWTTAEEIASKLLPGSSLVRRFADRLTPHSTDGGAALADKSRIHHKLNADGQPVTTLPLFEAGINNRRGSKGDPMHEEPDFERLTASARRLDSSR
jgi:hypothetical protein